MRNNNYKPTDSGLLIPAFSETKQTKANAVPLGEAATTDNGRDITRGYIDSLPIIDPQDEILLTRGANDYGLYRQILSDWQVKSVLNQRQLALTACENQVIEGGQSAADKSAADFIRDTLAALSWDNITQLMHFGVFYGFAVGECIWTREGKHVALTDIKVRDRRRFAYAPTGELKLLTTKNPQGELMLERKFWQFATGADHDDEPYGLGLAHYLYWPVLFKRSGIKFWLIAAEKFGSPTNVGWFPPNATAREKQLLLAALRAITTDGGIILPEGMKVDTIESKRSTSADHEKLCRYMDEAIAKIVLGQTSTSEAVGGQYKSEIQNQVRVELIKADGDLICESFNNSVVKWLTEWNFPTATPPRVQRLTEPKDDLNQRAERDGKVAQHLGYRPSLNDVTATYGGEWEVAPVRAMPTMPTPSQFNEPITLNNVSDQLDPRTQIDDALTQFNPVLPETWLPQVMRILRVEGELAALHQLADIYPQLPEEQLIEQLTQVIFVSNLWGRLAAQDND